MSVIFSLKHVTQALEFHIEDASSLVGRSENCDVQIDSETLSREHARLLIRNEVMSAQDLHSTNGTFVNGIQIHNITELTPGDIVRFGQESFYLQHQNADATVLFDRNGSDGSSMYVHDEDEDEDCTVMLQSISLPIGWSKSSSLTESNKALSDSDTDLLKALQKHARTKLKHTHGMLVTITQSSKVPSVKLLSSSGEHTSWKIGRGKTSDIQLSDGSVSDHHADISFSENTWQLTDVGSRNGTLVNNKNITQIDIATKKHVSIGPYTLTFEPIEKSQKAV